MIRKNSSTSPTICCVGAALAVLLAQGDAFQLRPNPSASTAVLLRSATGKNHPTVSASHSIRNYHHCRLFANNKQVSDDINTGGEKSSINGSDDEKDQVDRWKGKGIFHRKADGGLLTWLVISFWKGLTFPFPVLRRVIAPPALRTSKDSSRGRRFTVGLSFREGIAALAVYLTMGVLAYSYLLEHWPIIDSLYFTCVCFSTVGYGDLCPTNPASKLFTCLFGLGGIAFLGAAVAAIGSRVVQAEVEAVRTARSESRRTIMSIFEGMPKVLNHFRKKSDEEQRQELLEKAKEARKELEEKFRGKVRYTISPTTSSLGRYIRRVFINSIPSLSMVLIGAFIMQRLNGHLWKWDDALYFALVTASTIGFGDLVPKTRAAKMFAVVFIPLSVAAAGELLSGVAEALVQRRQMEVYEKQLEQDFTIEHLRLMDGNGDGQISREEYVQFMLKEMGRVTQEEIDELILQFNRLDVTRSGYLDNDDLKLMAKLRGATVRESRGANQ